jgi:hypothetical protein
MTTVRLPIVATSRAQGAGYLALADLADLAGELDTDYRIVRGQMVSLLVAVSGATDVPERDTLDADFGVPYQVAADQRLTAGLTARGYQSDGAANRFVRRDGSRERVIDVLAPSYTSRLHTNQAHGDLILDEIPGLSYALAVPAVSVELDVTLTDQQSLRFTVSLPDPAAAIAIKVFAYTGRRAAKDALDIWRLLEAARALGVTADTWPAGATPDEARTMLIADFGAANRPGARDAASSPQTRTRIAALVTAVCGH